MEILETYKNIIFYVMTYLAITLTIKYFMNGPKTKLKRSLDCKVAIVTGSSSGIGINTAYELLKSGATVIFACRDEEKTKKVINAIKDEKQRKKAYFLRLDLSSFNSVINFANEFKKKFDRLDLLVNNAACQSKSFIITEDKIEKTIQTNTLSPILLSFCLLDHLNKTHGRVVNVSSDSYKYFVKDAKFYDLLDITDYESHAKKYHCLQEYRYSKLGNIYFTQELDEYIEKNRLNVQTVAVHPGVIFTQLGRDFKLISLLFKALFWFLTKSPETGAQTTLHACFAQGNDFNPASYYTNCAVTKLMTHANDQESRKAFINLCKRYFALHQEASNLVKF